MLRGVADSCAYSNIIDPNKDCPPFVGMLSIANISASKQLSGLQGVFRDKGAAAFQKSQFIVDSLREIRDHHFAKTGSVNYGILLQSTEASFVFMNYLYRCALSNINSCSLLHGYFGTCISKINT